MTQTTTIPQDWPRQVRLAIQAAKDELSRQRVIDEAVDLLRREDPMGLRHRGLDAHQRRAIYAAQVDAQARRAA